MNKLLMVFFLLIASLAFKVTPLFSEINSCATNESNLVNCFWDDDEDYLYFNIDALEGLTFDEEYYSVAIEEGQICAVIMTIPEEKKVIFDEGNELKRISIIVSLESNHSNQKNYTIISTFDYEKTSADGIIFSTVSETKKIGTITSQAIELIEKPIFFTLIDQDHKGIIGFKYLNSNSIAP
jgi:hypothetical protein